VTTTRTVFESVILGKRTLADAMEHREIRTIGEAKAVSDLWVLLVDFETGFPIVKAAGSPNRMLTTRWQRWTIPWVSFGAQGLLATSPSSAKPLSNFSLISIGPMGGPRAPTLWY
jgi:hypothetical protein